jgi:plasmid stability protein
VVLLDKSSADDIIMLSIQIVLREEITMAQMSVRDIPEKTFELLKQKAKESGKSSESLVRELIEREVRPSRAALLEEIDRIRAMSKPMPDFDSTKVIREARDRGYVGD